MKKIDWYIIQKFITTFFFVALIFTNVAMIIDFSENVEEFIEEDVTTLQVITEYYLNFMLWINGLIWPLYALISVIFFTSRMAYNSEIISIFGAGVSFRRMMMPYMAGAFFLAGLHFFGNHIFIPKGNKKKLDFEHTYIWKESDRGKKRNVHMFIGPNEKIYVRYFRDRDSTALDIRLEHFEDNRLTSYLKANTAEWQGPPNKWRLKNYEIRSFEGLEEELIIGQGKVLDTVMNLLPQDFVRYNNQKEMMSTPELFDFIELERHRGLAPTKVYTIEIHRRTADAVTIIILTIIGVAVASRKVRGGMGLHLALGIGIGALFIFMSRFSVTFAANQSLSAALGVWIPNIVFSVVAFYLVLRAQK
jgi:lipopolysaccharide export system permease protein